LAGFSAVQGAGPLKPRGGRRSGKDHLCAVHGNVVWCERGWDSHRRRPACI